MLINGAINLNIIKGIFLTVVDQLKEMRLEISQFNHKTGLLELKNEHQDEEIRSLKNIISQLTVKRNEDEEIKSDQELEDDGGVGLME